MDLPSFRANGDNTYLLQQPFESLLAAFISGGRSIAGFPSKKPSGLSVNPVFSQGMT
jgi:hypothetical protein